MSPEVRIIGAGLAGTTAAYTLRRAGFQVEVIEAKSEWGGQLRTASANGILYEPTGAHIFHTRDGKHSRPLHEVAVGGWE